MAVLYLDYFSSVLTAELAEFGSMMYLPEADAARIRSTIGFGEPAPMFSSIAANVIRIPLWLDDGTHRELVLATYAQRWGVDDVAILHPSDTSYTFGVGTVVRCAPTADFAAAGHLNARDLETGNRVMAVPGETLVWAPTGPTLTVEMAFGITWGWSTQGFNGDCWPARIELANLGVEMTVNFKFNTDYEISVYQPGVTGGVSSLTIPATAQLAVLTLQRPHAALRALSGSVPHVLCNLELFG